VRADGLFPLPLSAPFSMSGKRCVDGQKKKPA
jgi:hypothetical protein